MQTVRLEKWMVLRSPDDATVGAANTHIGIGNSFSDFSCTTNSKSLRAYRLGRIQEMRAHAHAPNLVYVYSAVLLQKRMLTT